MLGHTSGYSSPMPSLTGSVLELCEGDTGFKKESRLVLSSGVGRLNVRGSQRWLVGLKGTLEAGLCSGKEGFQSAKSPSEQFRVFGNSALCWLLLVIRLNTVPVFPV